MEVFHGIATECHLPYGITQGYLLPDTSEHTPPVITVYAKRLLYKCNVM